MTDLSEGPVHAPYVPPILRVLCSPSVVSSFCTPSADARMVSKCHNENKSAIKLREKVT
jgi:hypothetical protein